MTSTLIVRTELIEALMRLQQQQGDGGQSLAEAYVRACPPLGDPAWAMEELARISPRADTWCATAMPDTVWATPGTAKCPFGTQSTDFAR